MEDTDSTMQHYAELAHGSYGNQDMSHLGYEIDPQFSNRNRTLYVNKDTGKTVYSFRGTDLKNKQNRLGDLGSDTLMALGLQDLSSRFRNANKYTKKAIEKYGNNLSLTGTSLGGSQALYVNSKQNVPAVAFNPYVNPEVKHHRSFTKFIYDTLISKSVNNNATIYRTQHDPISVFSNLSNAVVKVVPQSYKNPHSIRNFFKKR